MFNSQHGVIKLDSLSGEQIDFLDELGINANDLVLVSGKKLHSFMIYDSAYTDGERLVFFDVSHQNRNKFIYYMGAENDAELTTLYKDVAVYDGISESRLSRYLDQDEAAEA